MLKLGKKEKAAAKAKSKKHGSVAGKALGIAALAYAGLFAVFYYDLDGKAIYYLVEPFLDKHYSAMDRPDMTKTPYGPKPDFTRGYYAEEAAGTGSTGGLTKTQADGVRYGVSVPNATGVKVTM